MPPGRFGPFALHELLAVGGMAEVYRATDDRNPRLGDIVVKRMLPHLRDRSRYRTMFAAEGALAVRLSHPNIVRGLDAGEVDGEPYIALEYVDGRTLLSVARASFERGEALPMAAVATVVHDVNEALRAVHDDGLVHRDVSPDNLMVDREGVCRLLDFGIAKTATEVRDGVTRTGELKGKVPYMSPEQVHGDELTAASDRYAVGAMGFFLLSSSRPFERERDIDLLNAIVSEAPAPLVGFGDTEVGALAPLISRLLNKAPKKRPTPDEIAAATAPLLEGGRAELSRLVEAAEGYVGDNERSRSTTRAVALERSSTRPPRDRRLTAALIVLALLTAAVAVVVFWPRETTESATPKVAPPAGATEFATRVVTPTPPPSNVDAGPPAPAAEPAPKETRRRPAKKGAQKVEVKLEGSAWIRWSHRGRALGSGGVTARLPRGARFVTARDTRFDLVSQVAVIGGRAVYSSLATGTVSVRALPYAEVFAGKRKLGTTPVGPLKFRVGTLTLKLRYEDRTELRKVKIEAGKGSEVRVRF